MNRESLDMAIVDTLGTLSESELHGLFLTAHKRLKSGEAPKLYGWLRSAVIDTQSGFPAGRLSPVQWGDADLQESAQVAGAWARTFRRACFRRPQALFSNVVDLLLEEFVDRRRR